MKLVIICPLMLALSACSSATASHSKASPKPDVYANFADLAAHQKEGKDFTVTVTDRSAPITVFAIHGGKIDVGTHLLAEPLAGRDWNLYIFKGIKARNNYDLHVTNAHFDEPRALALAAKSRSCISIHGHHSDIPRIDGDSERNPGV